MRAWEKCKDAAQRSSVPSLHFYGVWALCGARIPLLTFFVVFLIKGKQWAGAGLFNIIAL